MGDILFEHRFWLQILGDHLRFIQLTLAPKETINLQKVGEYLPVVDSLLERARQGEDVTDEAFTFSSQLQEFKGFLLFDSTDPEFRIAISLPQTFINHMINEIDEYISILNEWRTQGTIQAKSPLSYHKLWINDASGHADSIMTGLDPTEEETRKKAKKFKKQFTHLYLKTMEFIGYMRAHNSEFPAVAKLTADAVFHTKLFVRFLEEIHEMQLTVEILSTLDPLITDHMIREECYYLQKLELSMGGSSIPGCDPTRPRYEGPTYEVIHSSQ